MTVTRAIDSLLRRLAERAQRALEGMPQMENVAKPCTCGNTRRHGPCPRHGKLT